MSIGDKIKVSVAHCWLCEHPILVEEGRIKGSVTFWTKDLRPVVTAHHSQCQFNSREVPEYRGTSNQLSLIRWWRVRVGWDENSEKTG